MQTPFIDPAPFALFGQTPKAVVAPAFLDEACRFVRDARGQGIASWGGGTRQSVGYPPERYDLALSTSRLNQITEYAPADMTVTVQAGVKLAALQARLAEHGQCLPLEIAYPDRQTVGGIIASRPANLGRFAFGTVRDALIGVKVVNGAGELIVGGGKVVKNVSGYDLPKLYCGSWGTLGLIVEATFKVAPQPECSRVAAISLPAQRNAEEALDLLLASEIQPSFLFLLNAMAARSVLEDSAAGQFLLVGFHGAAETVAWQLEQLGAPALPAEEADGVVARLRDFPQMDSPMRVRLHILSSQVGAFTRMLEWTARRAGFAAQVAADAGAGIVHGHFFPESAEANWARFYADFADKATRVGGSCIIEQMPQTLRDLDAPVWTPILSDHALMARLKATLDPERMWNPGRFVGRI
jgi:glycolate oxidase FAD binding subunit